MYQRPPPRRKTDYIGTLIIAGLALLAGLVFGPQIFGGQIGAWWDSLAPSCTIGVLPATITVQGWSASDDCSKMLTTSNNITGINWGAQLARRVDGPDPGGTTVCAYSLQGRHITVREAGPSTHEAAVVCTEIDLKQAGELP